MHFPTAPDTSTLFLAGHLQIWILSSTMSSPDGRQKLIVVGAGPVGALAAMYAATRGDEVEIYELRAGKLLSF